MSGDLEEDIREQVRKNEDIYLNYQSYRAKIKEVNSHIQKSSTKELKTFVDLELLVLANLWKIQDTLKDVKKGFQYLEDEISMIEYTKESVSSGTLIGGVFAGIAIAATGSFLPLAFPLAGALLSPPFEHVQRKYRMRGARIYAEQLKDNVERFYGQCARIQQTIDTIEYIDERQILRSLHRFNFASITLRDCLKVKTRYCELAEAYRQWNA